MTQVPEPVRVAVNVMRARLTILGFNIAIITFQINNVGDIGYAVELPGIGYAVHIAATQALFMGLALSIMAMISFIASGALDREGACTHWSLLAGDLLMYLALAQTVVGFFGPFVHQIDHVVLADPLEAEAYAVTRSAVTVSSAVVWAMAVYLGPVVSLIRSPFTLRTTVALGLVYAGLVLTIAKVSTTALHLQAMRLGHEGPAPSWLGGLFAPLQW